MQSLITASWIDAERVCVDQGSHLWAINSFDEWWNVFQLIGYHKLEEDGSVKVTGTKFISSSTLTYIGASTINKVLC